MKGVLTFFYCSLGVSVKCVSRCLQYPKAYVVMKIGQIWQKIEEQNVLYNRTSRISVYLLGCVGP